MRTSAREAGTDTNTPSMPLADMTAVGNVATLDRSTRAQPTSAPSVHAQRFSRNWLADVRIEHGPRDLFNRLFLRSDTLLRERGINLQFAPVEELLAVNRANRDSWRPLVTIFDAEVGGFKQSNGFVLLGRNAAGEVIAAQAARVYDMTDSNLKIEAESLRLFYEFPDRFKGPNESCEVTAAVAERFTGQVVYSGAVWYRPDYRKQGLTSILPRLTKAYAMTKWPSEGILSLMIEDVVAQGTARRAGYYNTDWEVFMRNTPLGSARAAIVWSSNEQLIEYFSGLLMPRQPQVDAIVQQRTA